MNNLEFTAIIGIASILAGLLGALTGLGGAVVVVPFLTLGLGVDIRYAIGAALVSVIATSSGAAIAYVREGYSNIRVGMFLEVATTFGAVTGALIAAKIPTRAIAIIFGVILLVSTYLSNQPHHLQAVDLPIDPLATRLKMDGSYPTPSGERSYHVQHIPGGFAVMLIAGTLSGLLGVGSGALKVLAMDRVMQLPFKVSTTTSNFMIGVTAAASAGIYFSRGYIDPGLCLPVLLGVLVGAWCGAKVLVRAKVPALRIIFSIALVVIGIQMIYNGITGGI
ncbi:sulfite exporter TauE/SafE family protein [Nostoc sp. TCL26-01]|uniref:sulfite exporter TauE/SafE family protein n=1 Tax=Nostoc sp. TCL26-01 TaxID=2576904 RepID=UPI0015BAEE1F|nr:sulfite exporter TauE/SafE family protein [Nostoc sp. TCL26-01]QLE57961.1 sulfite exporter TauE/SafE family protein [Nostoc sp. TCL26-01]